jgi:hypothetical protein
MAHSLGSEGSAASAEDGYAGDVRLATAKRQSLMLPMQDSGGVTVFRSCGTPSPIQIKSRTHADSSWAAGSVARYPLFQPSALAARYIGGKSSCLC